MLRVIGQVLIQVGQAVGVLGEAVVHDAKLIAGGEGAEAFEIDEVQGGDVVRLALREKWQGRWKERRSRRWVGGVETMKEWICLN